MSASPSDLSGRLRRLRHPGRLTLGDAARRLGAAEGRVAEALARGGVLPGDGAEAHRLRPELEGLLECLLMGGPIAIGVDDGICASWRIAHHATADFDRPALRIRWDGADLVLPADGLRAYAIRERTPCPCGERRSIALYDVSGRPLARMTQAGGADPALFTICRERFAEREESIFASSSRGGEPPAPAAAPPRVPVARIIGDLQLSLDAPPLSVVAGRGRYLMAQHATSWMDRSAGRRHVITDGCGWVSLDHDALSGARLMAAPGCPGLHAVEVDGADGGRVLAIMPQQAPDGRDPDGWAGMIRGWRGSGTIALPD